MGGAQFEEHYRASMQALGLSLEVEEALDAGSTMSAPAALHAWYRVAGRSWLNSAHNRILGPDELHRAGDMVIFAEENQAAVVWGFDASPQFDDPMVWQGQVLADDGFDWYSEEVPLSRFIVEMIRETVAGSGPVS